MENTKFPYLITNTRLSNYSTKTADIYLAFDKRTYALVALKHIHKNKLTEDGLKYLNSKLKNLDEIKHKNIISFKRYGISERHYGIFLEYCNGGDLSNYLKNYIEENQQPLNEFLIQKIIKQIAPAIEYMNSKNIIHRDIKLENILINFDDYPNFLINGNLPPPLKFKDKSLNKPLTIKIADIIYSKNLLKNNEGSTILGYSTAHDTIDKNINEKKDDITYNTSIDLWSLGAITYELLTGSSPIMGKTIEEIYQNFQKGIYSFPKKLICSIEIISFINGLLQNCPEKRLNWEQIKEHPFLIKDPNDFINIELERLNMNEKDQIEKNSNGADNLLWIFFKCSNLKMNIDKINQKEVDKPEVNEMIEKLKVTNTEVQRSSEEEEIENDKVNQKLKDMISKAEEELKKEQIKKDNIQKEQEKIINDENEIKKKKNELILNSESQESSSKEDEQEMADLDLKLEKSKSDKEANDKELKNTDQKISEKKNIIDFGNIALFKNKSEKEIKKLDKKINNTEKEIKKLREEKKDNQENIDKEKEKEIEKK